MHEGIISHQVYMHTILLQEVPEYYSSVPGTGVLQSTEYRVLEYGVLSFSTPVQSIEKFVEYSEYKYLYSEQGLLVTPDLVIFFN